MRTMTEGEARRWEYQMVAIAAGGVLFAVLAMTVFPAALGTLPGGALAWVLPTLVVVFLATAVLLLAVVLLRVLQLLAKIPAARLAERRATFA